MYYLITYKHNIMLHYTRNPQLYKHPLFGLGGGLNEVVSKHKHTQSLRFESHFGRPINQPARQHPSTADHQFYVNLQQMMYFSIAFASC